MNTQHLRYAIEVEQTGSITQAAENLYIGQPSLSKAIKELEETLGIVIFKRTSKGAVPTEKGAEFLRYARAVMVQIEKMESLQRPEHPERQALSVSFVRSGYIAMAAADFTAELDADKEMDVELCDANAVQVMERVDTRKSAIGVVRYNLRDETYFMDYLNGRDMRHEPLWEFDAMVLCSRKHPLADRPALRAEALFQYVEIGLGGEEIPFITSREDRRPDERGDKRICVYDPMNQYELLSRIPGSYAWGAPLPDELRERYGLIQLRCPADNMRFRDELIYRQGHEFAAVEKRFINKLYEHKNRIIFQNIRRR